MANPQTVSDVRAMLRAGLAAQVGQGETPAPDVLQGAAPAEAESPVVPSASGKPAVKRAPVRRKKG